MDCARASLFEAWGALAQLFGRFGNLRPLHVKIYDIPVSAEQARAKLREEYLKNKHVRDIRVIDLLVIKGQMELVETLSIFKQKSHVMNYFKETVNPKPTDFMSKFLSGY
uniref:NADH dehydrogenase [ubiquinone] 1 alpha subcomplex subunit 6 n=1 Tax=Amblyomma maculatum TaxID=34609 RepID=G3MSX3_AMBMU